MSKIIFIVAVAFFISSCNPIWNATENLPDRTSKTVYATPKTNMSTIATAVIAERALRLRSYPEGFGGREINIMPNGSEFHVYYCQDFSGTLWAFGSYVDAIGKTWVGYAAARYLSGGCD